LDLAADELPLAFPFPHHDLELHARRWGCSDVPLRSAEVQSACHAVPAVSKSTFRPTEIGKKERQKHFGVRGDLFPNWNDKL